MVGCLRHIVISSYIFQASYTKAQIPEYPLSLSTTVNRILRGNNPWTTGLVGTQNNVWSLPTAESVRTTFGGDTFISATGMVWGMGNGNDGDGGDAPDPSGGTGFSFKGRQAYTGEYVAQMYVLEESMATVDVSFDFAGPDAISTSSFSIWRVTSSSAEMLAASESTWAEGSQTFSVTGTTLSRGERLLLIWNSNNAGKSVTISNFSASYTKVPEETLDFMLTDAAGNEYPGTFVGVKNMSVPTFTLPYGATLEGAGWVDEVYKATVNFPFPVSNAGTDGTRNAVTMQTFGNTSYWYADANGNVIADPASATVPTEANAGNFLWYIYPEFADGQFAFKLYNVGAQKYIPANVSSTPSNTVPLAEVADAGSYAYTATGISNGAGFSVPNTSNYLSLNSSNSDGQNLFLWTKSGTTHQGSNVTFRDVATEFAALSALEPFNLVDGAIVISPTEYDAPKNINAAITAASDCNTDVKKLVFLLGDSGNKLKAFKDATVQHGEPLEFTYTIRGGKWGTLFPRVNFIKPAEWTLYQCPGIDEATGVLQLTEQNAGFNKNLPYLVKTTATEDKTYQIIGYSNGAATLNTTVGLLTGVVGDNTNLPEGSYILASDSEGTQAFHKIAAGVTKKAAENKAFITLPAESEGNARSILYISQGDIVTSIDGIIGNNDATMLNGKYVRNGRVVIVKNGVKYNTAGQIVK